MKLYKVSANRVQNTEFESTRLRITPFIGDTNAYHNPDLGNPLDTAVLPLWLPKILLDSVIPVSVFGSWVADVIQRWKIKLGSIVNTRSLIMPRECLMGELKGATWLVIFRLRKNMSYYVSCMYVEYIIHNKKCIFRISFFIKMNELLWKKYQCICKSNTELGSKIYSCANPLFCSNFKSSLYRKCTKIPYEKMATFLPWGAIWLVSHGVTHTVIYVKRSW